MSFCRFLLIRLSLATAHRCRDENTRLEGASRSCFLNGGRREESRAREEAARQTGTAPRRHWPGRRPATPVLERVVQIQICGREWSRTGLKQQFLLADPQSDAAAHNRTNLFTSEPGLKRISCFTPAFLDPGPEHEPQSQFSRAKQLDWIYAAFALQSERWMAARSACPRKLLRRELGGDGGSFKEILRPHVSRRICAGRGGGSEKWQILIIAFVNFHFGSYYCAV